MYLSWGLEERASFMRYGVSGNTYAGSEGWHNGLMSKGPGVNMCQIVTALEGERRGLTVRQLAQRVRGGEVSRADLVSIRYSLLSLVDRGQVWPVESREAAQQTGPERGRRWGLPEECQKGWARGLGVLRAELVRLRCEQEQAVREW